MTGDGNGDSNETNNRKSGCSERVCVGTTKDEKEVLKGKKIVMQHEFDDDGLCDENMRCKSYHEHEMHMKADSRSVASNAERGNSNDQSLIEQIGGVWKHLPRRSVFDRGKAVLMCLCDVTVLVVSIMLGKL
ncbi:hypothetical protein C2G38_2148588 [Gigaspora rosea]|uniref:Uncharacterized protein n=1 Tax=Gigaspora rosea TaxID=44941 RepID=A0A397U9C9_9GLOM|nr:hypothetical protein C2G38_2148588 [Gigaspora rosea]